MSQRHLCKPAPTRGCYLLPCFVTLSLAGNLFLHGSQKKKRRHSSDLLNPVSSPLLALFLSASFLFSSSSLYAFVPSHMLSYVQCLVLGPTSLSCWGGLVPLALLLTDLLGWPWAMSRRPGHRSLLDLQITAGSRN